MHILFFLLLLKIGSKNKKKLTVNKDRFFKLKIRSNVIKTSVLTRPISQ